MKLWLVAVVSLIGTACGSAEQAEPGYSDTGMDGGADAALEADAADDVIVDPPLDGGGLDTGNDTSEAAVDAGCGLPPSCDAPLPDLGSPREFNNTSSKITAAVGPPRHRGRDLFLLEGAEAWALGKFAYGVVDDDIKDEEVDVYLLRDCGDEWTYVGTRRTSKDGENDEVHGVQDTGGRLYLRLSDAGVAPLSRGRHRVLMVVAGDLTYADQFIEVIHPDAKIVVTDIDGTLTSSEYAALTDVIGLPPAEAHPGAADMMWAFASRGYHLFYLTARPEWMMPLSREWLPLRGFPPGVVHTTLSKAGALGAEAVTYKSGELAWLATETGIVPSYGFGNKDSDVEAYVTGGLDPSTSYYFDLDGDLQGGVGHSDYTALVSVADSALLACW